MATGRAHILNILCYSNETLEQRHELVCKDSLNKTRWWDRLGSTSDDGGVRTSVTHLLAVTYPDGHRAAELLATLGRLRTGTLIRKKADGGAHRATTRLEQLLF